jgi:hypothetical protein
MARIPEPEIEHLKATVSLLRLVEAKGVQLERHGDPAPVSRTPG